MDEDQAVPIQDVINCPGEPALNSREGLVRETQGVGKKIGTVGDLSPSISNLEGSTIRRNRAREGQETPDSVSVIFVHRLVKQHPRRYVPAERVCGKVAVS